MLILDPNIYKPNWNPKMLAFLQSSFLPQVPVKQHTSVCSPFTLNTHTHAWKHPYQRRWRPGTPRADWRAAWGMNSPAQVCLILPQAEIAVSVSAWQHTYTAPGSCVAPPPDRKCHLSCSYTSWSVLRRKTVWLTTNFYSVYSCFPGH